MPSLWRIESHSKRLSSRSAALNKHAPSLGTWVMVPVHKLSRCAAVVAVGGDARVAASFIAREENDQYWLIDRDDFVNFVDRLQSMTLDDIVDTFQIPYDEAEPLVPALTVYQAFLAPTSADTLIVPNVSIRDGVLLAVTTDATEHIHQDFYSQVVASARSLVRKYHADEVHACHVTDLALSLFDQLTEEHGLNEHHRLLLEVSALLHDIGSFINPSGHHKHGAYIVANSDIFGLKPEEIEIIANVVRYHRKALPDRNHADFVSLARDERILVMKLAAILRVADGMDRSHRQRIKQVTVEMTDDELRLHAIHEDDLRLAQHALASKGAMFEDVFGLKPVLMD